ncbi:protein of unknown function [Nitratireductor aquimarinus]
MRIPATLMLNDALLERVLVLVVFASGRETFLLERE